MTFKSLYPSRPALSEYRPFLMYKPPSCHSPSESRTLSPCQADGGGCKKYQKPLGFALLRNEKCTGFQRAKDCQKPVSRESQSSRPL